MSLRKDETKLVGGWHLVEGRMEADDVTKRIRELIRSELRKVAADESGWDVLYQDPADGRYWERIYPQSEMHGGGPPTLRNISVEDAKKKYGLP